MKASKNLEYEKKLLELRLEGINKGIAKNRRFIQLFHKRLKLLSLAVCLSWPHWLVRSLNEIYEQAIDPLFLASAQS
jgi:hypothetical protein